MTGDQRVFVSLLTLEMVVFEAIPRYGHVYWRRVGTDNLLTESQMTVARWGRADHPRYQGRRLLEMSRKLNMRKARSTSGEERCAFIRTARARNYALIRLSP